MNDERIVRRIASLYVPVALNTDRLPSNDAGQFFRQLMKQWPQGLWIVTSSGETLAFHYHKPKSGDSFQRNQQRWVEDTLDMLTDAARKHPNLPVRQVRLVQPFPDRGIGMTADGGVRLAVSVIGMRNGRQEGSPAVDSVLLSQQDWQAFAPQANQLSWSLSSEISQRFAPALSPMTDSIFVPRVRDVTHSHITGEILRETEEIVVIRYRGRWESLHHRDGNPRFPIKSESAGSGIGVFDKNTKRMRTLIWVLRGNYTNGTATTRTGSVIDWKNQESDS